jgi:putative phosphoribosyl transferase
MTFRDRNEAGRLLADALTKYAGLDPVVLAVPRGSVAMGRIIAERLNAPLDLVLVHKIGAPNNPELAIGSVTEFGDIYPNEVAQEYRLTKEEIERLADIEIKKLKDKSERYRAHLSKIDVTDKTVIIVDDGIATGATILAAIRSIRKHDPKQIIVATAVAPPQTVATLNRECDEVVVLHTPERLWGVGMYFEDFSQVSDEEVERILEEEDQHYRNHIANVRTSRMFERTGI